MNPPAIEPTPKAALISAQAPAPPSDCFAT
jgi:hypothetical protein